MSRLLTAIYMAYSNILYFYTYLLTLVYFRIMMPTQHTVFKIKGYYKGSFNIQFSQLQNLAADLGPVLAFSTRLTRLIMFPN